MLYIICEDKVQQRLSQINNDHFHPTKYFPLRMLRFALTDFIHVYLMNKFFHV
jgi:hypothetical protein